MEPPTPNTSAANGSSCTQPFYGMPMNTFVEPPQPPPLGTRSALDTIEPFEGHLGSSGIFCRTVWPYTGTCTDYLGKGIYYRTIEYTLEQFGPIVDRPTPYAGPSGYAYAEPGATQYAQFSHPSQQHYSTPPATYYNHAMPPYLQRAKYSTATREIKRYMVGGVALIGHLTYFEHPCEEIRQKISNNLKFLPPSLMYGHQMTTTWSFYPQA
jgi:hypothetical protein